MKTVLRYFYLQRLFFSFKLKSMMEYRLNFLLQMLHGPSYVFMMYMVLSIAFDRAGTLAGWTKSEGMLLFLVYHTIYLIGIVLFLKGVRYFVWEALRRGDLDGMMTKPVSLPFLVTFSNPEVEQLPLLTGIVVLLANQMHLMWDRFTPHSLLLCLFSALLAVVLHYLSVSSWMTLAFSMTRATQIIELHDKISDFAQYPTPIFPASIQWFTFSIVPIAFFGYVPTSYLLDKAAWWYIPLELLMVVVFLGTNRFGWERGLRNYTSASS